MYAINIVSYHIKKFGYQTENIIFSLTNVEDKKKFVKCKTASEW